MSGCLACDLTSGKLDLPGGRIHETTHWVVEHCVGPLGVGTLIVKPLRHCIHFWELTEEEVNGLGFLLRLVEKTIQTLLEPDQIYICQWSHDDWNPEHIHFVVQPSWNYLKREHKIPGAYLQVDMCNADKKLPRKEVEEFCLKARTIIKDLEAKRKGV
jgi:diadenosine tetraphosphate (Ap4A) HIT family hydrolase